MLIDIRDENRQNMASLQAQMHIMQERITRMDTKQAIPSFMNHEQMNSYHRLGNLQPNI